MKDEYGDREKIKSEGRKMQRAFLIYSTRDMIKVIVVMLAVAMATEDGGAAQSILTTYNAETGPVTGPETGPEIS